MEFAGLDNEAPFVTDGVVLRHLTALRWKKGPEVPAFGGGATTLRDDRRVHLKACDGPCAANGSNIISEADVVFKDQGGLTPALIGSDVELRVERKLGPVIPRAARPHEDGFTIVELLITCVIMSLIAAALTAVLSQGFSLLPDVQSRTSHAYEITRTTNAVSDDIANAVATSSAHQGAAGDGCALGVNGDFVVLILPGRLPALQPRDHDRRVRVEVGRYQALSILDEHDHRAHPGYCYLADAGVVWSAEYADPAVTIKLRLAAEPGGEMRLVTFGGNRRTTG